jgi:flagellar P-ring protein precursor FlgI
MPVAFRIARPRSICPVSLQLKNVAAVMVTPTSPVFAQVGQSLDVTVSSIGTAKSRRGCTLLITPLKGADGQIYGMAQGNVLIGRVGAKADGSSAQVNRLSVVFSVQNA